jgi:predicted ATPase
LRKTLGDGQNGTRYIANVPARGYCFVAPVSRPGVQDGGASLRLETTQSQNPIYRSSHLVGRDTDVQLAASHLAENRFVTIVGPGGIGKTSVATAIAHTISKFDGHFHFIDLAPITEPHMIASVIASTLGLTVRSQDPLSSLVTFLKNERLLLILDSCEHLIETVAELAETIFREAPEVYVLATSREPLRIDGEHVYRLPALAIPPEKTGITADEAMAFSAVQLFVARAQSAANSFQLTDVNAPAVSEVCRRLDGMALALELAAGRVEAYGIDSLADLLKDHLQLTWQGKRTSLARHRTLQATLDWSYNLLSDAEKRVLRRLAVFVGLFPLEAAIAVARDEDIGTPQVLEIVASLVAKSLIARNLDSCIASYRLLDTTRAYLLLKLKDSGEHDAISLRHARFYLEAAPESGESIKTPLPPASAAFALAFLSNARVALSFCFAAPAHAELARDLAVAVAPLFLKMCLLTEAHAWTGKALSLVGEAQSGSEPEMRLQAYFGQAEMFTKGNTGQVERAFRRSLELAHTFGQTHLQFRLLVNLHLHYERIGRYREALHFAERSEEIAKVIGDPAMLAAARSMLGIGHHLMGDQLQARACLEASLAPTAPSPEVDPSHFGFEYRNRAQIALARVLWLQGEHASAVTLATETVKAAAALEHTITQCMALIWAASVYIWHGDYDSADESVDEFLVLAKRYELGPYQAAGLGFKAKIAVRRGQAESSIQTLRACLERLHRDRYELLTTAFECALSEALLATGNTVTALLQINEAMCAVEEDGNFLFFPELLRIRAQATAMLCPDSDAEIERTYLNAITLADRQNARSWHLRAAVGLAKFYLGKGREAEARAVLERIYPAFDGSDAKDYHDAAALITQLGSPVQAPS